MDAHTPTQALVSVLCTPPEAVGLDVLPRLEYNWFDKLTAGASVRRGFQPSSDWGWRKWRFTVTVELGVKLFQTAFWIYLAAAICYVGYLLSGRNALGRAGTALLAFGLAVHTGSLVIRTVASGRPPFLNLYEYMLSFTWGTAVVYLALERIAKSRSFGSFAAPFIAALSFLTCRLPSEINPTMPALRSAWRVPHIAAAVLSYAAFGIAFVLGVMYLAAERGEGGKKSFWTGRLPSPDLIDLTIYRMITFGFMMLILLIVTGAIWAQRAWGSYWSWDPKETWALITWLIYAAYLHMRTAKGWKGRRSAVMAIIGFIAVIFTLFGVNLLGGLHSYAK